MYTLGTSTTLVGGVGAATLPNTGGFQPLFFTAVALLALGVTTLIANGIVALKRRADRA